MVKYKIAFTPEARSSIKAVYDYYYWRISKQMARNINKGIRCVFSNEIQDENSLKMTDGSNYKRSFYGTISYIPALFGLYAASEVIGYLLKDKVKI